MKNILSHLVKILLLIFIVGVMLMMRYILPVMADQAGEMSSLLASAKNNILIISEILCVFLIAGFVAIIYLLFIFDSGKAFTKKFVKGLEFIIVLSIIVTFIVAGLSIYLGVIGGIKHLVGYILVGGELSIIILIVVTLVIRKIILDAIAYKQENDLTV